jgi:murein DD-endopeptidase MepM/ murein hydrolase activator NlpD
MRYAAPFLVLSAGLGMACSSSDAAPAGTAVASSVATTAATQAGTPVRQDFQFDGAFQQGGVVLGQAPSGTQSLTLGEVPIPLDRQGRFLIAFGRDHGANAVLTGVLEGGDTVRESLTIRPTNWRIERVNASRRGGRSSADFRRRRAPEIAQIVAAREVQSQTNGWRQRFLWPTTGRISGQFGSQRIYRGEPGSYHSGVDIVRPGGTPVVAPADGVVVLATATPFTLEGYLVIIDHGMSLNSAFLHLSRIDVAVGDRVERGQRIALVGSSGRATGAHLHWGMKWGTERIDPRVLAGPMPVRN